MPQLPALHMPLASQSDFQDLLGTMRGHGVVFQLQMGGNRIDQCLLTSWVLFQKPAVKLNRLGELLQKLKSHGLS
jgi:hypothetical protein